MLGTGGGAINYNMLGDRDEGLAAVSRQLNGYSVVDSSCDNV